LQSRVQGLAVLLGHNNTLNVSRAFLGALRTHPEVLHERITDRYAIARKSHGL
jgi:hypothetical protein